MTPHRSFSFAIALVLSAPALSADDLVDRADANGDGVVSLYELRAAYYADAEFNQRIEQSFADYDTDGDGLISESERRAKQVEAVPAPETKSETRPETRPETKLETTPDPAPAEQVRPETAAAAVATATVATGAASSPVASDGNADARVDASASGAVEEPPQIERTLSRSEALIVEIDADDSGGASIDELVSGGDGRQWFTDSAFESADKNGDEDLDADELEVLLRSLERRRH